MSVVTGLATHEHEDALIAEADDDGRLGHARRVHEVVACLAPRLGDRPRERVVLDGAACDQRSANA